MISRWCVECGKRHRPAHPHYEHCEPGENKPDASAGVAGAGSPEELAEQARIAIETSPQAEGRRIHRVRKEQAEDRAAAHELAARKWIRWHRIGYGLWARLADDPKIALTDKEATDAGEVWADMMEAFDWKMSGKIAATADVLFLESSFIVARSKWAQDILAEPEGEPEPPREVVQ